MNRESIIRKVKLNMALGKYKAISSYKVPDDVEHWDVCNTCGLKPIIWEFNNGRSTSCGCGRNEYDHFSIYAESIMSVVKRNHGSAMEYNSHELKTNWNIYQRTGITICDRNKLIEDGKW